ncbi:unnamed protein product [Caenorhabditis sp. 36 PRJEB53466]|nr:unnamed protein product [Caenorhabditis sp. 36 PRJEB53466]
MKLPLLLYLFAFFAISDAVVADVENVLTLSDDELFEEFLGSSVDATAPISDELNKELTDLAKEAIEHVKVQCDCVPNSYRILLKVCDKKYELDTIRSNRNEEKGRNTAVGCATDPMSEWCAEHSDRILMVNVPNNATKKSDSVYIHCWYLTQDAADGEARLIRIKFIINFFAIIVAIFIISSCDRIIEFICRALLYLFEE